MRGWAMGMGDEMAPLALIFTSPTAPFSRHPADRDDTEVGGERIELRARLWMILLRVLPLDAI